MILKWRGKDVEFRYEGVWHNENTWAIGKVLTLTQYTDSGLWTAWLDTSKQPSSVLKTTAQDALLCLEQIADERRKQLERHIDDLTRELEALP